VSYAYDLRGDLTGLTYPSGKQVTRGFDPAGRLTSVQDWLANISHFQYDADGNLVAINYANGVGGAFGYDQADRAIAMNYSRASQNFMTFAYTRNGLGQVTAVSGTPMGATAYSYDSINRLNAENQSPLTYDPADNITQLSRATFAYDVANELLNETGGSSGMPSLMYDSRGNRLQETGPGMPRIFQYDQANRLTAYGAHATYAYNGDGLRSGKAVSGDSEAFAWDVAEGLPLLLADGRTQFIYGPNGQPLEQVSANGGVLWFHQDQLGSTRALTNTQGATEETYNFNAYGQRLGLGLGGNGLPALTPLLFAGQYTDAESGLQYLRARYYDPSAGQFLTRDPQILITRTPYLYGSADPVNRTDPSGADDANLGGNTGDTSGGSSGSGGSCPEPPDSPVEVAGTYTGIWSTNPPTPDALQTYADLYGQDDPAVQKLKSDLKTLTDQNLNPGSAEYKAQFQNILNNNSDVVKAIQKYNRVPN